MTKNEEVRVLHGGTQDTTLSTQRTEERVLHGTEAQPMQTAAGQWEQQGVEAAAGEIGRLQLLEERAVVNVQRQGVGQVQIRKVLHERQEMVPVTITSEVLEITVNSAPAVATGVGAEGRLNQSQGISEILIDGQPLQVGQTYTIPLTEERYQVVKQVYPISNVVVRKRVKTETHQESVTLRHEELDVKADEGLAQTMDVHSGVRR